RLSPREGCEPRLTTSTCPSDCTSPTIATILLVPISSPTTSDLSGRLAMTRLLSRGIFVVVFDHIDPAHGQAVGVAHVDHPDRSLEVEKRRLRADVALQTQVDMLPAEHQYQAVVEPQPPGATFVDRQLGDIAPDLPQLAAKGLPALEHLVGARLRPAQARQPLHAFAATDSEDFAALAQQTVVIPARDRAMLDNVDQQSVGPPAADFRARDPGPRLDPFAAVLQVRSEKALAGLVGHGRANLAGAGARQLTGHVQPANRPLLAANQPRAQPQSRKQGHTDQHGACQPHRSHRALRLVSRIRHTSSSKSIPSAFAAMGMSE